MLEQYLRAQRKQKRILLMTHIVVGYPSLDASRELVDEMVSAGVDLMELQIPFSEPIADGPVILHANQKALAAGVTLDQCFAFAEAVAREHPLPFLFMSYYNLLHRRGVSRFVADMKSTGLVGAIVPDLPHEEGKDYLDAMSSHALAPIFIFSPNTSTDRLSDIARHARGFVYCVARKGVTGRQTEFSAELDAYLARCRAATDLPLAVGFGVSSRRDVEHLIGRADIAVIGSQTIRLVDEHGVGAVRGFLSECASPARG